MVVDVGRLAQNRWLASVGSVQGLRGSGRPASSGERQIREEIMPGPIGLIVEGSNHPMFLVELQVMDGQAIVGNQRWG
ncbi:hypothetical protein RJT34_05674 [Clitoria ternatea]|uniref:Uncharacterized protein n=1 Tax=Clitoria ternatea TaxID=43366 RepID=A0AAN9K4R7_CLITE